MQNYYETAVEKLSVQGIFLKEGRIFVRDQLDPILINTKETITQTFHHVKNINEFTLDNNNGNNISWEYRFIFSVGIRLLFSSEEEASKVDDYVPVIEIGGSFAAKYHSKEKLIEEEQKAFSEQNVGYHVWPYWREYVQSSCGRVGFSPGFNVPLYIVEKLESSKSTQ
jgi:hypothetical protein